MCNCFRIVSNEGCVLVFVIVKASGFVHADVEESASLVATRRRLNSSLPSPNKKMLRKPRYL